MLSRIDVSPPEHIGMDRIGHLGPGRGGDDDAPDVLRRIDRPAARRLEHDAAHQIGLAVRAEGRAHIPAAFFASDHAAHHIAPFHQRGMDMVASIRSMSWRSWARGGMAFEPGWDMMATLAWPGGTGSGWWRRTVARFRMFLSVSGFLSVSDLHKLQLWAEQAPAAAGAQRISSVRFIERYYPLNGIVRKNRISGAAN